jgi:hypothetical protein
MTIHHIVAKVAQKSGGDELVVTDEIKVAVKVEDAVNRIGSWTGDIFAVWSVPSRPNPAEAAAYVQDHDPESMWLISGEMPYEMADRYLETLKGAGGRG